jgi:pyruvate dehydrogenase E2 component (dihydrolipoamide acetyltransferase)
VRSHAAGALESSMKASSRSHDVKADSRSKHETKPEGKQASLSEKYGDAKASKEKFDAAPMVSQPTELPDFTRFGAVERIPLRSIRRKIAKNMMQSWTHIPHVTHFDEADVTALIKVQEKHDKKFTEMTGGARLTMTVFAVKAVVSALKKYPQFNASLDEATGEIVFKHYYNIGIAVATERGLIVPVIHNADQKSLFEIAQDLQDIAAKTRSGKIELDRLQGGTFTITNIGAIGGTSMVPMINYPEAAILGMARGSERPVVRDGKIEIATILPLALSFDHRLADGAEAAYFVKHVIERMEDLFHYIVEE